MKAIIFTALGSLTSLIIAQVSAPFNADSSGLLTGSAVTILGTIVIAFVRQWIVPGITYQKLELQLGITRKAIDDRNRDDREVFIPLMTRALDALATKKQDIEQ